MQCIKDTLTRFLNICISVRYYYLTINLILFEPILLQNNFYADTRFKKIHMNCLIF